MPPPQVGSICPNLNVFYHLKIIVLFLFIESASCSCLLNYISKLFCAIFLKTGSIRGKLLTTCTFIEKIIIERERERLNSNNTFSSSFYGTSTLGSIKRS